MPGFGDVVQSVLPRCWTSLIRWRSRWKINPRTAIQKLATDEMVSRGRNGIRNRNQKFVEDNAVRNKLNRLLEYLLAKATMNRRIEIISEGEATATPPQSQDDVEKLRQQVLGPKKEENLQRLRRNQ